MGFYQELSRHYDEVFAVDSAEMHYIAQLLQGRRRILDIGCGTGNRTVHLSAEAEQIVGIDLDEGMIAKAMLENARSNIHYAVADMLDIDTTFIREPFDGIVCLGNTLVHLPSPDAILEVLKKIYELLAPGGISILQILNYDRIINEKITCLPVIDTANTRFERRYAWLDGDMRFITTLTLKETGQSLHNDISLYPLRKEELSSMLAATGFLQTEYYGSYQGAPLQDDSFVTIAVSRKV